MKFNELEHIIYCVLFDENCPNSYKSGDFLFTTKSDGSKEYLVLFDIEYGDISEYCYKDENGIKPSYVIAQQIEKEWDITVIPSYKPLANLLDRLQANTDKEVERISKMFDEAKPNENGVKEIWI